MVLRRVPLAGAADGGPFGRVFIAEERAAFRFA